MPLSWHTEQPKTEKRKNFMLNSCVEDWQAKHLPTTHPPPFEDTTLPSTVECVFFDFSSTHHHSKFEYIYLWQALKTYVCVWVKNILTLPTFDNFLIHHTHYVKILWMAESGTNVASKCESLHRFPNISHLIAVSYIFALCRLCCT